MRKRIVLIIVLMLVLVPATTFAEGFKDIKLSDWFYQDITELHNIGVINGYEDGTFKPSNKVTNSEALQLILNVNNIKAERVGGKWDSGLIQVASDRGLINIDTYDGGSPITRLEVAEILVGAMGAGVEEIEGIEGREGREGREGSKFNDTVSKEVNYLHKLGIIKGVKLKTETMYYPDSDITRAEMSTIINRVNRYNSGQEVDPHKISKIIQDTEKNVPTLPKSQEDFEKLLIDMASRNTYSHIVKYDGYNKEKLINDKIQEKIFAAFTTVFSKYPEQYGITNMLELKTTINGKGVTLELKAVSPEYTEQQAQQMRKDHISKVEGVVNGLIRSGKITTTMSETEKAKVLYEWVILNTEYDQSFSTISYNGYGQITTGKAVCQGYVSTYNLMLKMVGIEAEGITGQVGKTGEKHIWTRAKLDGNWTYIDVTFGDPITTRKDYCDYSYFDVTRGFLEKTHIFN